jgi:16S rRNA (guanine527-N7)-methyltransferase
VQQIRHLALPSGKTQLLALKGGDLTEELRSYPNAQVWNLTNLFDGPFFETKKLLRLPIKPAKFKKG